MKIPKELIGKITIPDQQKESNSQKFLDTRTNKIWLEVHIFKRKEWFNIKGYSAQLKRLLTYMQYRSNRNLKSESIYKTASGLSTRVGGGNYVKNFSFRR